MLTFSNPGPPMHVDEKRAILATTLYESALALKVHAKVEGSVALFTLHDGAVSDGWARVPVVKSQRSLREKSEDEIRFRSMLPSLMYVVETTVSGGAKAAVAIGLLPVKEGQHVEFFVTLLPVHSMQWRNNGYEPVIRLYLTAESPSLTHLVDVTSETSMYFRDQFMTSMLLNYFQCVARPMQSVYEFAPSPSSNKRITLRLCFVGDACKVEVHWPWYEFRLATRKVLFGLQQLAEWAESQV